MAKKIITILLFFSLINFLSAINIWEAAEAGDLEQVIKFIEKIGVDVSTVDNDGKTPLHYAAEFDQKEVIDYLISKNANINAKTKTSDTILQLAIQNHSYKSVKSLVDNNVDITVKLGEYGNGLSSIIDGKNIYVANIIELCLYSCSSLDINEKEFSNSVKISRIIYDKNKKIDSKKQLKINNNYLNIDNSIILGDLDIVKDLIKKGYSPGEMGIKSIFITDDIKICDYFREIELLDKKDAFLSTIDCDSINIFKNNVLPKNINNLSTVNFLVDSDENKMLEDPNYEFNIENTNIAVYTILARAVNQKSYNIVKELIINKVDCNIDFIFYLGESWYKTIPLFIAISNEDYEMVKLLVEAGSDLNYVSNIANTYYNYEKDFSFSDLLTEIDNNDIKEYLKAKGLK